MAFLHLLLLCAFFEGQVDVVLHEVIDHFIVFSERFRVVQPVVVAKSEAFGEMHHGRVEVFCEVTWLAIVGFFDLAVHRFAEQKLARAVDCEAKEECLDVGFLRPAVVLHWHHVEQILHVAFFELEVGDLVSHKVGLAMTLADEEDTAALDYLSEIAYPQHSSAMLPSLPVLDELHPRQLLTRGSECYSTHDAVTKRCDHVVSPRRTQIVVFKIVRKHSLDVLRITCEIDLLSQKMERESRAFPSMQLAHLLLTRLHQVWKLLISVGLLHHTDLFETEKALARILGWLLTS